MKIVVALGLVLAFGLGLSHLPAPPAATDSSVGSMPAGTESIVVLATTADRGELEPCGCSQAQKGGLARRATLADSIRALGRPVLLLDAGDHTHPAPEWDERLNQFQRQAMAQMGYDAITLGELELERGAAYVRAILDSTAVPITLANVRFRSTGKPLGQPVVTVTRGRIRSAVIGLLAPELAADSAAAADFTVDDPVATARTLVPELRRQAELVIVLAHLSPAAARALPEQVPGIDVVVLGHERNPLAPAKLGSAVTLTSGERGQWLAYAQLAVPKTGGVADFTGGVIPLILNQVRERADLATALRELHKSMNEERRGATLEAERRLEAMRPLPGQDRYLGDQRCARCHAGIFTQWQSTKHAHAFATLVEKHRDMDPECLSCHVTGFEVAGGFHGPAPFQDMRQVQCESCHGMGTQHDMTGKLDPDPGEAACKRCHTPEMSPEFDFRTYWPQVAH
jgi:2',3'-cyclic-nucleotide 2'-phosphodiesterase (5'-nucleotidase family)